MWGTRSGMGCGPAMREAMCNTNFLLSIRCVERVTSVSVNVFIIKKHPVIVLPQWCDVVLLRIITHFLSFQIWLPIVRPKAPSKYVEMPILKSTHTLTHTKFNRNAHVYRKDERAWPKKLHSNTFSVYPPEQTYYHHTVSSFYLRPLRCLGRLTAGLTPRKQDFDIRPIHVGFVVDI